MDITEETARRPKRRVLGAILTGAGRLAGVGGVALLGMIVLLMTLYTVPEGHVGVVKRWSKAVGQVGPGLHVKIPIADRIEKIEIRQRKNVEDLAAATQNQLPTTATVSINWTVNRESAMDLFIQYGGLNQFENRILDPKLRNAAKEAIGKFPADQLIRDRQAAVATIMEAMARDLEGFPVTVNSPQIENLSLPKAYLQAVEEKERAREDAEKEKHRLEQQRLVAQQAVNSAEANAEAKRIEADAEAYRVTVEAEAEADAIRLINEQLSQSPLYVDLVRAKKWDGILPQTVLGDSVGAFLSLPVPTSDR